MDGGVGICGIPVEMKAVGGSNGGDCGGVGICGIPVEMKAVTHSIIVMMVVVSICV